MGLSTDPMVSPLSDEAALAEVVPRVLGVTAAGDAFDIDDFEAFVALDGVAAVRVGCCGAWLAAAVEAPVPRTGGTPAKVLARLPGSFWNGFSLSLVSNGAIA